VYYVSLAPQLYSPVVAHLGQSGLASEERGWRRIVLEKPFGQDRASAHELNRQISAFFQESQVYRIDHYLGKETVQNMLALRFANTIFEPLWNRNYIEHIQITVAEEVRVGTRGAYYDSAGVLRDMFQNHLLQILALIAMEPPSRFEATALRDEKVKVLDAIRVPAVETVQTCSSLGQYTGYQDEPEVSPNSRSPTYAALRLNIDNWRWQGIPFYLRSGKGMTAKTSEVIIQFLCPPHMIFTVPKGETIRCNRLVVTLQPDEGIHLAFQTKLPDQGMTLKESNLYFHYRDSYPVTPIPDAYETLLLDVLEGDASLFIRNDEIELAWRVIDPIIAGWEARTREPLPEYEVGSWGPPQADAFMRNDGREWVNGASLHHDR
jgi:glucose-6-phosphate 1-dehydrogenase